MVHFSIRNFFYFFVMHVLFFFIPFPLSLPPIMIFSKCNYQVVYNMSFLPRAFIFFPIQVMLSLMSGAFFMYTGYVYLYLK